MKRYLILLFVQLLCQALFAQEPGATLSLEQAISLAQTNNVQVRQSSLQAEGASLQYRQAKTNLLPEVNAAVIHGINQGRSIDPFTNSYINQEIVFGSYGLSGSLLLFNGFTQRNSMREGALGFEAAQLELQQIRNNTTLSVILAYLQVLNNEDLIAVARKQVSVTREQLERLGRLHEQGAVNPPQMAELRGQLMAEELVLSNARLSLSTSRLALTQLMNVPYNSNIRLEPLAEEGLIETSTALSNPRETYQEALQGLALVKAAQFRRQSAEAALRAQRGNYAPSLFLFGNYNSNYSSAAQINGERIYYQDQLRNNIFSTLGVSLRIPILNYALVQNRVAQAKLNLQEASLLEENTKVQLRQEVEQAHLNVDNARERYSLLQQQEVAYAEAFRAAEVRFNAGVGTSVDYLLAKNNHDRSSLNLIMAKNEYLLRLKMLEYYRGK